MSIRGLFLAVLSLSLASSAMAEEDWWSFRPLLQPRVPRVKDAAWVRTPVDAFILHALEARGLRPGPQADRLTLLRRLSFDLLGLPPTPAQIEAFVHDNRPDAYERLVELLLASPAYGERWGRHWLDVAHYGDTHGYDKDKRRDNSWPYRDWVIRSFNEDLPYRDFIREQVAGDVLHPGDPRGAIAAGFVVAGPWDFVGQVELREGTKDKEITRVLDRDDMVSSALGSFMSLTVGCARCHDHKFDPISMRDYYRLQAVFSGVERGNRHIAGPMAPERRELLAQQKTVQAAKTATAREIAAVSSPDLDRLDRNLAQMRKQLAALPATAGAPSPSNGYHSGITATPDVVKWVQIDLGEVLGVEQIRLFPARPVDFPDTPGFGFPLRFRLEASDEASFARPQVLADHTRADFVNPGDSPFVLSLKEVKTRHVRLTATRLWKRTNDYCLALGEMQVESRGKNVAAGKNVLALDTIDAGRWHRKHLVDGFDSRRRLPDVSDPQQAQVFRQRLQLAEAIRQAEAERVREVNRVIPAHLRSQIEKLQAQATEIEAALKRLPEGPMVYSVLSIPPRPIWVLKRGSVERRGEQVEARGLDCIPSLPGELEVSKPAEEGQRRLALANWVRDERNVLTWRSIVNRVWHYHFGKGIVDTPNDFGKMGSLPSHPELLDWLAVTFRDGGGSFKQLHRLLVTSAVYRQVSAHDDAAMKIDSDNRLLWRMNRRRLDAESLRDAVLAVSGQLDRRMGGPGYELFRFKDDHSPIYDHSDLTKIHAPQTYRRTVYRFTVRSVPNPMLDCLDCADPNQATPVRNTTLTALQALTLMNHPFMVRQASHFAERLKREGGEMSEQIRQAYRIAFGSEATREEVLAVKAHAEEYGLGGTCRVLFNANEFVFVD